MVGSLSDFLENRLNDHVLGNTAYSAPASVYLALFTAAPTEAGGGTAVSGGGYARLTVTNNTTNWGASTNGIKTNLVQLAWPAATANWGTIVAVAIMDALTSGNMLYYDPAITPITINSGQVARFEAGDLSLTYS